MFSHNSGGQKSEIKVLVGWFVPFGGPEIESAPRLSPRSSQLLAILIPTPPPHGLCPVSVSFSSSDETLVIGVRDHRFSPGASILIT